jgi:hypothetical protein
MMRKPTIRAGLAALALLAGMVAALAATEAVVGKVERLRPQAVMKPAAGASVPLSVGAEVRRGAELVTGDTGRLTVRLGDGAELRLGENTRLTLTDAVYRREEGAVAFTLQIVSGAMHFIRDALRPRSLTTEVRTPSANIFIRGSDVWIGAIDGGIGVLLRSGLAEVRNGAGAVTLAEPGQGTMIFTPGRAPSEPIVWGEAKVRRAYAATAPE